MDHFIMYSNMYLPIVQTDYQRMGKEGVGMCYGIWIVKEDTTHGMESPTFSKSGDKFWNI